LEQPGGKVSHFSRRVIIIDHQSFSSQSLKEILVSEGYDIRLFTNHDCKIEACTELNPDLIIVCTSNINHEVFQLCNQLKTIGRNTQTYMPVLCFLEDNGAALTNQLPCVDVVLPISSSMFAANQSDIQTDTHTEVQYALPSLLQVVKDHTLIRDLHSDIQKRRNEIYHTKRILDRELRDTEQIQRSFLTRGFPQHPQIKVASIYEPSIQIGGDYYDIFPVDDNHWGIVMADIAGHGSSAAIVMAMTQLVVRDCGKNVHSPNQALLRFNERLKQCFASDHYITMFYGILELSTMQLTYCSAGHVPTLYYSATTNDISLLHVEPSFPLRTFETEKYDEYTLSLSPDDKLILYTDGVVDLQNMDNVSWNSERLIDCIKRNANIPPNQLGQSIFKETEKYRGGRDRLDDFTLLILERISQNK
jgi:serine phosphatase RsbU (regulator of sigma subunit)/CheY-like chemotaxis protein